MPGGASVFDIILPCVFGQHAEWEGGLGKVECFL